MSSFQGVGIEGFRGVLISGGWNRGSEVSSFQGVGIEGNEFHFSMTLRVKICLDRFLSTSDYICRDFGHIIIPNFTDL